MIRRRLLVATAIIASVVLAACSDMTAPKNEVCPITNGSQTC
jgi:PBP1b-binding outer membrane lipoprotein LpoB